MKFDVFLSHNGKDKPAVEILAHKLEAKGFKVWLDKWNLIPGEPWQEGLEEELDDCQTYTVFVGPSGIGPWENEEMRVAIEERVKDKKRRVIPVLLPGAPDNTSLKLPRFLTRLTWVDFRIGIEDTDAFHRLCSGITGTKPRTTSVDLKISHYNSEHSLDESASTEIHWGERDKKGFNFFLDSFGDNATREKMIDDEEYLLRWLMRNNLFNSEENCFTIAGAMLFGPEDMLPVQTDVIMSNHSTKSSLIRLNGKSLIRLAYELLLILEDQWSEQVEYPTIRGNRGQPLVVSKYPKLAIQEALVNFIIHRDYSVNQEAHIDIYKDKLVFTNPGFCYYDIEALLDETKEPPIRISYDRSPIIIKTFSRTKLNQRERLGLKRIKESLSENGNIDKDGNPLLVINNYQDKNLFSIEIGAARPPRQMGQIQAEGFDQFVDLKVLPSLGEMPPGSRIPYVPNPTFTGRTDDLLRLASIVFGIDNSGTVITQAITGMGGVGKTQLAVEFAYRYGKYFNSVHWLNLADPEAFDSEIASCGLAMVLPNWPKDRSSQVSLTLQAWKASGPRLIILDNFEDITLANDILSKLRHSNIRLLITSRHSDWPATSGLSSIPLALFTNEESLAFLKESMKKRADKDDELNILSERLGFLPLALELASRYLNGHSRLNVTAYLDQAKEALEHTSMKGWRTDLPASTGHDLDLQRTFALSWLALKDETAQQIFQIAGYLAPNTAVPLEIFEKALELSSDQCDEALAILYGLGLLRESEYLPIIHPLLAEFARQLSQESTKILEVLADTLATISKEETNTGLPARFISIKPHIPVLAQYAESRKLEYSSALWNNYGYYLKMIADYSGARAAYERAMKIDVATFGINHPDVAIDVNNLGSVLQDLGDLAGARVAYEHALKIWEANLGIDHPQVATGINNLGMVMKEQGDLVSARAAFERSLKIDEASFGPDHPSVAIDINNLGLVLQNQGDLNGAREAFERSLKIDEATFGSDHPNVAIRVNNLGSVIKDQGDLVGARIAYERALAIFKKFLPPDHPNIKTVQGNLDSLNNSKT